VLSLLTLSSCLESKYPLTPVKEAKLDERLIGVWTSVRTENDRGGAGTVYLHIGAEEKTPISRVRDKPEPGLMRFVCVDHGFDKRRSVLGTPASCRFFVSKINDEDYANLLGPTEPKESGEPPEKPYYFFMKYKVEGDQLTLWAPDPELLEKAVKNGDLAGTVVRKGRLKLEEVELTATSEQLTAFLKTEAGKKVFADQGEEGKLVFHRLHE
jgi:hypothetical protein